MNSLGIDTKIFKTGIRSFTHINDVLSKSEFTNCFYLHDIRDSSMINAGTIKILNVTCMRYVDAKKYVMDINRCCVHPYFGPDALEEQIVTLIEFIPTIS